MAVGDCARILKVNVIAVDKLVKPSTRKPAVVCTENIIQPLNTFTYSNDRVYSAVARRFHSWLLATHQCLSALRSINYFAVCLCRRFVLVTENLALRQQLLVLQRATNRPGLRRRDRLFWVTLSHLWRDWRSILVIVKPETVIKWHRQGFKCYWRWKSRSGRVGRPKINQEIRDLIRRMSRESPTWGAPRIQAVFSETKFG